MIEFASMSQAEWLLLIILGYLILSDLYSFVFRDRIEKKIYQKTVEDVSWNKDRL